MSCRGWLCIIVSVFELVMSIQRLAVSWIGQRARRRSWKRGWRLAAADSLPCSQRFVAANPSCCSDANQEAHRWFEENYQVACFVKAGTTVLAVEFFFPLFAEFRFVEIAKDLDRGGNHVQNGKYRDLKYWVKLKKK